MTNIDRRAEAVMAALAWQINHDRNQRIDTPTEKTTEQYVPPTYPK